MSGELHPAPHVVDQRGSRLRREEQSIRYSQAMRHALASLARRPFLRSAISGSWRALDLCRSPQLQHSTPPGRCMNSVREGRSVPVSSKRGAAGPELS